VFLDPVDKTHVPAVLREIDAGLLHLTAVDVFRYGISPNKLFDYLAAERPVLFACRSSNDPIRDVGAGLSIPPDDPPAMAAAMQELASRSADELRAMGGAGRAYVEAHHDSARLAAVLANEIEVVIREADRPKR
jgi:glycosyltransferase involved in cell wall biosynthesis